MATGIGLRRFKRYSILTLAAILFLIAVAAAEGEFTPVYHPTLNITRTSAEIKIDGQLRDPGWSGAAYSDQFVENSPGDQIKPPVATKAYITYDDDNLYVAIVCWDDPAQVRASYCERDEIFDDDNVGFFMDTYGDATTAYMLNVNPYGFQYDALNTSGFGEDGGFDMIWQSAGIITDSGYQVEIAIPFSTIRFPGTDKQVWRADIWRHYNRDSYHSISWAAYDRDEPCFQCQWGTLTGIENINPGKGLELIGSAVAFQSGQLEIYGDRADSLDDTLSFVNNDIDQDLSFGMKYAPTSNITAELTVNPDFSQVEADANQIDVNTNFALSYPEKRPFFQEGSDMLLTPLGAVYTRSINNPLAASKVTARFGRTSISYLAAYDENSPVILPFDEFSTQPFSVDSSVSNIVRLRQTFGTDSRIGLLVTDRRYIRGGSGSAFGIDGNLRLSQPLKLNLQAMGSYTVEPKNKYYNSDFLFDDRYTATFDGERFWGHGIVGSFGWSIRDYGAYLTYTETSPSFRLDNGNVWRNDRREAQIVGERVFRMENGLIEQIYSNLGVARVWDTDGWIKDGWIMPQMELAIRKWMTGVHLSYMYSEELYHNLEFNNIWQTHICVSTSPAGWLSFGGSHNYGHRIARNFDIMGLETRTGIWVSIRPIKELLLENSGNYALSMGHEEADTTLDGQLLYRDLTWWTRINFQYSRALSLRLVVQYRDFTRTWDIDPLLTYHLSPFSLFYVGTTYDYAAYDGLNDDETLITEGPDSHSAYRLKSRQFFMKLQYLFQI